MKFWLPLFSYQAILLSLKDAESTSSVAVPVHVRRKDRAGTVGGSGDDRVR